jgi:hypothetical protein
LGIEKRFLLLESSRLRGKQGSNDRAGYLDSSQKRTEEGVGDEHSGKTFQLGLTGGNSLGVSTGVLSRSGFQARMSSTSFQISSRLRFHFRLWELSSFGVAVGSAVRGTSRRGRLGRERECEGELEGDEEALDEAEEELNEMSESMEGVGEKVRPLGGSGKSSSTW